VAELVHGDFFDQADPVKGQKLNIQAEPAVMNVGYSMPPAPNAPGAGSTTVSVL